MSDDKARCYHAGSSIKKIDSSLTTALSSKDNTEFRMALYDISQSGRFLASMLPEAKDLANKLAHRGRMLLKLATDLGDKTVAHEKFFSDQLMPLREYAHELDRRAKTSCLGYEYATPTLPALPSIPKDVSKAAVKERDIRNKDILKRHRQYLKKTEKKRLKK